MELTSGSSTQVQQYFAKYLTSPNLLELQLGDSNFRRYIFLQFLIMFQYLDTPVKFKQYGLFFSLHRLSFLTTSKITLVKILQGKSKAD